MTTPSTPARRRLFPTNPETAAWILVGLLAVLAVVKLSNGFERLLLWPTDGAVDLKLRYDETRAWFAGWWIKGAVYPPASQTILLPIVGWLPFRDVRGLWAVLNLGCLAWLCAICARECGLRSTAGRAAFAILPLAMSSTASSVSIGQLAPVVLPLLVTAVLWMARGPSRWPDSIGSAVLFTLASVKPTLFAPFAWLVLLLPRSRRPAILSATMYALLTIVALAALKPARGSDAVVDKLVDGIQSKMNWATEAKPLDVNKSTRFGGGYGNLQNMSETAGLVGLENFVLPVASVIACGAWAFRRRRTDPWILIAVCAFAARLGWYHRLYDDMLLLLPMVALARIAASKAARPGEDRAALGAMLLLGATGLQLIAPSMTSALLRDILGTLAFWVWIVDLVFLANVAPLFEPARAHAPDERDDGIGLPATVGLGAA
ncbi:MAG: glycosyltransferase family 87 protein [Alphaproteobacteria bacterium]